MIDSNNKPNHYEQIVPEDASLCKHLYRIPPRTGRYIVLDTETTGLNHNDHVVELGAHEIINGKLTGVQFHIYIRPRLKMCEEVIKIHGITNDFYDEYYKEIYSNDKKNLLNFIKWLGNSLIFAHNASFDMNAINIELKNWGINEFPVKRFRCSMKMFKDVVGRIEPNYYDKYVCLEKCCEYFGLKSTSNCYHNALFDAFMTARMVCKLYEIIDNDVRFRKFKREIKFNPNCYKNYSPTLGFNKYRSNSISNFQNIKFLNRKKIHDKEDNIKFERKSSELKIHKKKNINENINNSPNEIMRSPESTMSTGNLDESVDNNKDEYNAKLHSGENIELSDDIIDEIFSDL